MNSLATFNGFTLRHADNLADVERLEEWIAADDAHRDIFTPSFFLSGKMAQDDRASCYVLEDAQGVMFYIRLSRAERVYIQFPPPGDRAQKVRMARGLQHGMAFLEAHLAHAGCEQWIFDTTSPGLRMLAENALGFSESTHELVRAIANPNAKSEASGANGTTGASGEES